MKRNSPKDSGRIDIELTQTEYDAIAAALVETMEALDDWEFQTRTGVDREIMRQLLRDFRSLDPESDTSSETLA